MRDCATDCVAPSERRSDNSGSTTALSVAFTDVEPACRYDAGFSPRRPHVQSVGTSTHLQGCARVTCNAPGVTSRVTRLAIAPVLKPRLESDCEQLERLREGSCALDGVDELVLGEAHVL